MPSQVREYEEKEEGGGHWPITCRAAPDGPKSPVEVRRLRGLDWLTAGGERRKWRHLWGEEGGKYGRRSRHWK